MAEAYEEADAATYNFCNSYLFWTVIIAAVSTVLNATFAHLVRVESYFNGKPDQNNF